MRNFAQDTRKQWAAIAAAGISAYSASRANKARQNATTQQQDWQKHMSDTAHQREVKDLRKAGLNPILSANSGATTPSGSTAQVENIAPDLATKITAASLAKQQRINLKTTNTQIAAQANSAVSQAKVDAAIAAAYTKNPNLARNRIFTEMARNLGNPVAASAYSLMRLGTPEDPQATTADQLSKVKKTNPSINPPTPSKEKTFNVDQWLKDKYKNFRNSLPWN